MEKEFFGLLSGGIVIASIIPYAIRTYQRKIMPNPTSWMLWTLINFAILLTYRSSGALANVWPAVFGVTNPLLIAIFLVKNRATWKKFERFEYACLAVGIVSLAMWWCMHESRTMVQYALYMAILADACAATPTVAFTWRFPEKERPFAWGLFALGYGVGMFAVSEHTVANYALPAYMFLGASFITVPLVRHRLKNRAPLKEWI
ncbi:MAG: hypothetical protein HY435_00760 [Candidatus Liptonbacteria bacterium]|nr:hypothetical protein [Candidatus Liptonbacteria bacterium]